MTVFIEYSVDKSDCFIHIDDHTKGESVYCPFCGTPVLPVKGKIKEHHYRHDGKTCQDSQLQFDSVAGWHHFNFNLPLELVEFLYSNRTQKPYDTYENFPWKSRTYKNRLFENNGYRLAYAPMTNIIMGNMSLSKFHHWFYGQLIADYRDNLLTLTSSKGYETSAPFYNDWKAILMLRLHKLFSTNLYLFQYEFDDRPTLYKIGRTSRSYEMRLAETVRELEQALNTRVKKASVLRSQVNAGLVEKYALYKYQEQNAKIGSLTEYFEFDKKTLSQVKSQFTRLPSVFPVEQADEKIIVSGRILYERKRLSASKKGIEKALAKGKKFGRPKGTKLSDDKMLDKHRSIVFWLNWGCSIRETAEKTNKGVSTVARVKKVLDRQPQEQS